MATALILFLRRIICFFGGHTPIRMVGAMGHSWYLTCRTCGHHYWWPCDPLARHIHSIVMSTRSRGPKRKRKRGISPWLRQKIEERALVKGEVPKRYDGLDPIRKRFGAS